VQFNDLLQVKLFSTLPYQPAISDFSFLLKKT